MAYLTKFVKHYQINFGRDGVEESVNLQSLFDSPETISNVEVKERSNDDGYVTISKDKKKWCYYARLKNLTKICVKQYCEFHKAFMEGYENTRVNLDLCLFLTYET